MTDWVQELLSTVPDYYDTSTGSTVYSILSSLGAQKNKQEKRSDWDTKQHYVDFAHGDALLSVGQLVGSTPQSGDDDETFRRRIMMKVREGLGGGTIESIKNSVELRYVQDFDSWESRYPITGETFQFYSGFDTYRLTHPPMEQVTQVSGVFNGTGQLFTTGTDWNIVDPDKLVWSEAAGAINPDDDTVFYVSYVSNPEYTLHLAEGHEQYVHEGGGEDLGSGAVMFATTFSPDYHRATVEIVSASGAFTEAEIRDLSGSILPQVTAAGVEGIHNYPVPASGDVGEQLTGQGIWRQLDYNSADIVMVSGTDTAKVRSWIVSGSWTTNGLPEGIQALLGNVDRSGEAHVGTWSWFDYQTGSDPWYPLSGWETVVGDPEVVDSVIDHEHPLSLYDGVTYSKIRGRVLRRCSTGSFHMFWHTTGTTVGGIYMRIHGTNSVGDSPLSNATMEVHIQSDNPPTDMGVFARNGTSSTRLTSSMAHDQWHSVRVEFSDDNSKYDVWVDGVKEADQFDYYNAGPTGTEYIYVDTTFGSNAVVAYIDAIRLNAHPYSYSSDVDGGADFLHAVSGQSNILYNPTLHWWWKTTHTGLDLSSQSGVTIYQRTGSDGFPAYAHYCLTGNPGFRTGTDIVLSQFTGTQLQSGMDWVHCELDLTWMNQVEGAPHMETIDAVQWRVFAESGEQVDLLFDGVRFDRRKYS